MQVVSLFSGCGGLDYGFEAAGFHVALQNDFDRYSCETLSLNSDSVIIPGPIENVTERDFRQVVGNSKNAVDVLIGGPPCQPFSKSAYWSRGETLRMNDPRANTLYEYFRVVEQLRPKAFLLENVHGISYSGKEEGFRLIIDRIREINARTSMDYVPSWRVVNAADFGVPQVRVRFILVALSKGQTFRFPNPSHADPLTNDIALPGFSLSPYSNSWSAIGSLSPDSSETLSVGGQWGDLLPSIPEGENYLWHTERKSGLPLFGWRTRYWSFLLKLAKNRPSWTIQAQPGSAVGPFHWENRRLSWKELAAIQTFPRTFRIKAPRVEIQRQIGNAVPSLLAEVLAREIACQAFGKTFENEPTLTVAEAPFCPSPEPLKEVPEKYLHLIGEHAAHPGTGKGRAYQDRPALENEVTLFARR